MYGKEQYSEGSPTVGALRFPVQQYQRMPGSARIDQNPASQQPQAPSPKQQTQTPPQAPNLQQASQQQRMANGEKPPGTCFKCGELSFFLADCPLED